MYRVLKVPVTASQPLTESMKMDYYPSWVTYIYPPIWVETNENPIISRWYPLFFGLYLISTLNSCKDDCCHRIGFTTSLQVFTKSYDQDIDWFHHGLAHFALPTFTQEGYIRSFPNTGWKTPKSSILTIWLSIINHLFWGTLFKRLKGTVNPPSTLRAHSLPPRHRAVRGEEPQPEAATQEHGQGPQPR